MKTPSVCILPLLLAPIAVAAAMPCVPFVAQDFPKLAPFTAVRWSGDTPEIRHKGVFYELVELESHTGAELVKFAQRTYGRRWSKRIAEDITQVLAELGTPAGDTVSMVLRDLKSGAVQELESVPMTAENRRAAHAYNSRGAVERAPTQRVKREHAKRMPREWKALMAPDWLDQEQPGWQSTMLDSKSIAADLDQLEWHLEDQFSYLKLHGVDYQGVLDALRISAAEGLPRDVFALQLRKILGLFGDGHTRLDESFRRMVPPGCTNFLLMDSREGLACVLGDRSGPLNPKYPFLKAIDGIAVEQWIEAAGVLSKAGSPAWNRRLAVQNLRYIGWAAMELGHDLGDSIELTLTDGKRSKSMQVPVAEQRAIYGSWPKTGSRRLDGDVGYLRIESMEGDPAYLEALQVGMSKFDGANGLIVDVRGNGGGTRDILKLLYPYFMDPDEAPAVVNVAKYKLRSSDPRDHADGYLSNRSLYPLSWTGWSTAERESIEAFAASFEPAWSPDPDSFSDWHYMVLSPEAEKATYSGPVKVLIDSGCFSATDIFASAFRGRPNVEFIGESTGGGSGRSRGVQLEHSKLRLRLSSMASFQRGGETYDGRGVHPDVPIDQPAEYFWGGSDAVLEAALAGLRK